MQACAVMRMKINIGEITYEEMEEILERLRGM